jgi:glucose 1-dehydrogenase
MDDELAEKATIDINRDFNREMVYPLIWDVADTEASKKMVVEVGDRFSRLDILVGNAGITNFGGFLDYTEEAFDRVLGVNLRGNYFLAQAVAQQMIKKKTPEGRIIFISSVTGHQAFLNLSTYGLTKAALCHLSKVLALELGGLNITANTISPGAIITERTLKDDPQYEEHWASVASVGRCGRVEDIASAALFLASIEARHITGQTIQVDGGWTIKSPIPEGNPEQPEESSKLK